MELTLNDIQEYLGQQGKKQGSEVSFSCPLCNALGRDRHGDNLKFNTTKSVLYCFCDDTHSGTLEELKEYRQQELEYIRVQLVCLLPFQTLEKAHRRLNMLIKEIERY